MPPKRARETAQSVAQDSRVDQDLRCKIPVALIVKLGGAAITIKDGRENLDEKTLDACVASIAAVHEHECKLQAEKPNYVRKGIVVVHGAGSYGHGVAKDFLVAEGTRAAMRDNRQLGVGLANTRLSVTKLNHIVTSKLVEKGIAAVGMSPFGAWSTSGKTMISAGIKAVNEALAAGLVPVVHGDAVLDEQQGCCILSGDTIMEELCGYVKCDRVVFLTNTLGVFDRPPEDHYKLWRGEGSRPPLDFPNEEWEEATKLLIEIVTFKRNHQNSISWVVRNTGSSLTGLFDDSQEMEGSYQRIIGEGEKGISMAEIETSTSANDVTGGINTKIESAVSIAHYRDVSVYIAAAGTRHGDAAIRGKVLTKGGPDANDLTIEELDGYQWFGTFIRKAQPGEPDYVRPIVTARKCMTRLVDRGGGAL